MDLRKNKIIKKKLQIYTKIEIKKEFKDKYL